MFTNNFDPGGGGGGTLSGSLFGVKSHVHQTNMEVQFCNVGQISLFHKTTTLMDRGGSTGVPQKHVFQNQKITTHHASAWGLLAPLSERCSSGEVVQ